jgi:hypothetical protein
MLKRKGKGLAALPLVALAALTLAACNDTSQPGNTNDTNDTVGQNVPGQALPGDSDTTVGEVDRDVNNGVNDTLADAKSRGNGIADRVTNELDRPYNLAGRSIETTQGEHLGQISKLVTDDAQNVYAVIELDGADKTPANSGSMVADIDDIDRTRNELVLMSQKADLEPYVPDKYKPLGVEPPQPQDPTVQ